LLGGAYPLTYDVFFAAATQPEPEFL